MKYIFFLATLIYTICISTADDGNCYLEGVSESKWMYGYYNIEVNDTHNGIVQNFITKNITGLRVNDSTYLNAYMKDDHVYVYATESFKYFERDHPHTTNPTVDIEIIFSCTEGKRKLEFYQNIIDTNNHAPHFYQDEYLFRFAMDIGENTKLTNFLPVKASDVDITNVYLQFTFEDENATEFLSVDYRAWEYGDKIYTPVLKTTTALQKPFRRSFTLKVEDSGEPPLISSTTITLLLIDPEDVVPSPVFNKSLTVATYDGSLLSFSEPITLKDGQWSEYKVSQKGLDDYISVTWSSEDEGSVQITLKKQIPEEEFYNGYVTMDIFAHNDNAFHQGRTSVLIYLQKS